jgi:hypothetical protein
MQPEQMTVVLTGACGGIGQLLARQLAAAGASLFLCGRDEASLTALKYELDAKARSGQIIEVHALDLTDNSELDDWIATIEKSQRAVNVLVNNAGICKFEMFEKLTDRDIERMMTSPRPLARSAFPDTAFTRPASTPFAVFHRPWGASCPIRGFASVAYCRAQRALQSIAIEWSK